jgi:hypothetical protein
MSKSPVKETFGEASDDDIEDLKFDNHRLREENNKLKQRVTQLAGALDQALKAGMRAKAELANG